MGTSDTMLLTLITNKFTQRIYTMKKNISILTGLAIATLLSSTVSMAQNTHTTTTKPLPKAFVGKWAGLHESDEKLTTAGFKELCKTGGEQDTSYFFEVSKNGHQVEVLTYWEDISYKTPVSYSKYSPTHIAGKISTLYADFDANESLDGEHITAFDYKISNNKLILTTDYETIELMKCS